MSPPVRVVGARLIWLAEVDPLCSLLTTRDTPLALELVDAVAANAAVCVLCHDGPTAFHFWPHPVAATLLYDALCVVRGQRRRLHEVHRLSDIGSAA